MKLTVTSILVLILGMQSQFVSAHDDKSTALSDACKVECPDAKNDHVAHKCLKGITKKDGLKAIETEGCRKALEEHELHEKKEKKHGH